MIKRILKTIIPNFILKYREKKIIHKIRKQFLNKEKKEIFKEIYRKKLWSPESEKINYKYYSGIGSHYPELTNNYIDKVKEFLSSFSKKPNVIDLGCGDFAIGSKIRFMCDRYIAVDVFEELINFNKDKYKDLNVDFRVLDITSDELPNAEVCFVRQVLQHLSNKSILNFVQLAKNKYKYLIITEHFPTSKNFVPNKDIPTGPDIRFYDNSAVVLTSPPFNLKTIKAVDFCETYSNSIEGVLKTKLLQLKD
tara:strand:- start:72 stop:824 length:753 start_codon:yes stop_codon:yes gene_type:complete